MEAVIVLIVLFSALAITTAIEIRQRKKYFKTYEIDREVYRRKSDE